MTSGDDDDLLAEQLDFYRADARSFDDWIGQQLDGGNDDPTAHGYRAGRARFAEILRERGPLGDVLEIAAGTGRLAELYLSTARSAVLLDASPESLRIASERLAHRGNASVVEADVFAWDAGGQRFDTIVFCAWLHHVPHSRFDAFWRAVESLLTPDGRVIFDFPDDRGRSPASSEIPDEPSEGYGFYAPADGISIRDHFGRRWRVVHHLWDPAELRDRLAGLGWSMQLAATGLFDNVHWATATRITT